MDKVFYNVAYMSCSMTKPTNGMCAQQRLGSAWAFAPSDQSPLCNRWVAKDPSFLHVDSKDSDQTGRMSRLIWVFAGRTVILLVLSWGGSIISTTWHFCWWKQLLTLHIATLYLHVFWIIFQLIRCWDDLWHSTWNKICFTVNI